MYSHILNFFKELNRSDWSSMAIAEIEPPKMDDRSPVAWVKHIDVSRARRWVTGSFPEMRGPISLPKRYLLGGPKLVSGRSP